MGETYVGASVATIFVIIALTLVIWTGFYVVTPDTPLSPRETTVVGIVKLSFPLPPLLSGMAYSRYEYTGSR